MLTRAISKTKTRLDGQAKGRAQAEVFLRRDFPADRGRFAEGDDDYNDFLSFSLEPVRDSFIQGTGKIKGAIDSVKNERPLPLPLPIGGRRHGLPAVGFLKKRDAKGLDIRDMPTTSSNTGAVNKQQVTTGYGFLVSALAINAYAKYLHAGDELKSCITSGVSPVSYPSRLLLSEYPELK